MRTFIQTIGSVPGPLSNAQFYMNKLKKTILVIFFLGVRVWSMSMKLCNVELTSNYISSFNVVFSYPYLEKMIQSDLHMFQYISF